MEQNIFSFFLCSFALIFCLQRKRSLASHLSGYSPSHVKDSFDRRSSDVDEETTEEQQNLDTPCSGASEGNCNYGVVVERSDSISVNSSSCLSDIGLKNFKCLVPVDQCA